jgi:hypothetical protein
MLRDQTRAHTGSQHKYMYSGLWVCRQGSCLSVWETVDGMDLANQEGWVGLVGRSNGSGPCRTAELDEILCQCCCFHEFKGMEQIHL